MESEGKQDGIIMCSSLKIGAVREALKLHFSDPKTRIMDDTTELIAEVLQTVITEAVLRAGKQAHKESQVEIHLEQVEKILPQLMLDFL